MFDDGGLVLETVAEHHTDDVMARFARSPISNRASPLGTRP